MWSQVHSHTPFLFITYEFDQKVCHTRLESKVLCNTPAYLAYLYVMKMINSCEYLKLYSQHFIFFVTNELEQQASVFVAGKPFKSGVM